jgi:(E)-4-hydroxy-3-methylbut-2-enyl-diphosphate synthase
MPVWKSKYAGVEELKVAVMGNNGPGEKASRHRHPLPGTFEEPKAPVFVDGGAKLTLRATRSSRFLEILDDYVENRYAASKK